MIDSITTEQKDLRPSNFGLNRQLGDFYPAESYFVTNKVVFVIRLFPYLFHFDWFYTSVASLLRTYSDTNLIFEFIIK